MGKTVVDQTKAISFHQAHEFLVRLEGVGLNTGVAQGIIEDKRLARKIVAHIKSKIPGYDPSVSQARARDIMRENFLGAKEVAEYFGIQLTQKELAKIAELPFSEETLQECKDTHILFLGTDHDSKGEPLTIKRFYQMFPKIFLDPKKSRLGRESVAVAKGSEDFVNKETPELRWYLISKSILEGSKKDFQEQNTLLKKQEYRERAIVYIYMVFLLFKVTGERLFQRNGVTCLDITSMNERVFIGYFSDDGLIFTTRWDRTSGLVPARKFDM